jgi:hypothetical protein
MSHSMLRGARRLSLALGLVLTLATATLAQDDHSAEFFPGKRVWAHHNGMLVPTAKIIGVNPDGSYKVEIYSHSSNNDPRTTQPEEAFLRGSPIAVIDAPASDIEYWNKSKFTAWVLKDGKPWPKAELVSDNGTEVKVRVFDIEGTKVEEERTITGADLVKFRELNRATTPAATASATIDAATAAAVDKINAEIAASGGKLSDGGIFPKVHTVPEVVEALEKIAEKYSPQIKAEPNKYKRAELQDQMMREIYVTFERMTWIKHGGRDTTTSAWKEMGRKLSSLLPSSVNRLQRDIIDRVNACYGKSKIVWEFLNLARIPELTGVGVRLLDGGFHGILYVEYDDHSRRTWETTEGFEPHGTRAFKRWEVMFSGRGSKGRGLDYMETITPMSGEEAPRLSIERDKIKARDRMTTGAAIDAKTRGMADLLKDRMKDKLDPKDKAVHGR